MSSVGGSHIAKKRRTYDDGGGRQGSEMGESAAHELRAIKSLMQELVDSNRSLQSNMNAMSDKMERLETRLHYQESMLRNQKWEYTVEPPSSDYWSSVDDGRAHTATSFLDTIREETTKMMHGQGNGHIRIDTVRLPYHSSFFRHWQAFADALKEYRHAIKCVPGEEPFKPSLTLGGIELPSSTMINMLDGLKWTHFSRVFLESEVFGSDSVSFALKYMKFNNVLEELSLIDCHIDNGQTLNEVCRAIKDHPLIETLSLIECRGDELNGFDLMRSIITAGQGKLRSLDLSGNDISTGGDTFLSDFLASNPPLEELGLSNNQLNVADAIAIAAALKYNKTLNYLDLDDNMISTEGWNALDKAEFDERSLNAAADSNHTCMYVNSGSHLRMLNSRGLRTKDLRSKKIYSVLSARNRECSNTESFEDVPIELLPQLVVSVQVHSTYHVGNVSPSRPPSQDANDVKSLSVVYEIMRRWEKVFPVYESLSAHKG